VAIDTERDAGIIMNVETGCRAFVLSLETHKPHILGELRPLILRDKTLRPSRQRSIGGRILFNGMGIMTTVTCSVCGIFIERPNWHAKRKQKNFCKNCRHKPIFISCDWCGKEKRISPSAKGEHNFCNRKCSRAWQGANGIVGQSRLITLNCSICGHEFQRQPNQIEKVKNSYCSRDCFYKAHRVSMGGEQNPAWRGGYEPYYGPNWDRQVSLARERDQYRCQRCGIQEQDIHCAMHVHHITPLRDFQRDFRRANDLVNLVCLCPSCHKFLEWHTDQMNQFFSQRKGAR